MRVEHHRDGGGERKGGGLKTLSVLLTSRCRFVAILVARETCRGHYYRICCRFCLHDETYLYRDLEMLHDYQRPCLLNIRKDAAHKEEEET